MRARGQLDLIGLLIATLEGEYSRSDDLTVRRMVPEVHKLLLQAGRIQAALAQL